MFKLLLLCLLLRSQTFAGVILYPGSFDIFHQAHYSEAQNILKMYPEDKLVIMPTEKTFYGMVSENISRPYLFSFEERKKL